MKELDNRIVGIGIDPRDYCSPNNNPHIRRENKINKGCNRI